MAEQGTLVENNSQGGVVYAAHGDSTKKEKVTEGSGLGPGVGASSLGCCVYGAGGGGFRDGGGWVGGREGQGRGWAGQTQLLH
jgi:hypothetical protein